MYIRLLNVLCGEEVGEGGGEERGVFIRLSKNKFNEYRSSILLTYDDLSIRNQARIVHKKPKT
jgi:hypothetical protein